MLIHRTQWPTWPPSLCTDEAEAGAAVVIEDIDEAPLELLEPDEPHVQDVEHEGVVHFDRHVGVIVVLVENDEDAGEPEVPSADEDSNAVADEDEEHAGIYDGDVALTNLLEASENHLGQKIQPTLGLTLGDWTNLGGTRYRAWDDPLGDKYHTKLQFTYDIGDRRVSSKYFAMDNLTLEMYPLRNNKGYIVNRHGDAWINLYIGDADRMQLCQFFHRETGWRVWDDMFQTDTEGGQPLARFCVSMDEPVPWVVQGVDDAAGTIGTRIQDSKYHGLYHCTGIFTASFNVCAQVGAGETIEKYSRTNRGRLQMHLKEIRVSGVAEGVHKIHWRPRESQRFHQRRVLAF